MSQQQSQLTDAQEQLIGDLDDVAEHVAWEFEPVPPESYGTCGFAHIGNIDGRSSFVQRAKSLADDDRIDTVTRDRRNPVSGRVAPVRFEIGGLELRLAPAHDSGYRLSISNVQDFQSGPAFQLMDVREELHSLVLQRLQKHGYLTDAYVSSRMD